MVILGFLTLRVILKGKPLLFMTCVHRKITLKTDRSLVCLHLSFITMMPLYGPNLSSTPCFFFSLFYILYNTPQIAHVYICTIWPLKWRGFNFTPINHPVPLIYTTHFIAWKIVLLQGREP